MNYTIEEIRDKILPVVLQYNISQVYLFGSYAKGVATEDSDIDLAINSSNLHGLWGLLSFKEDVSKVLRKPVDILTLRAIDSEKNNPIKKEFIDRFVKERICLYEQGQMPLVKSRGI